MEKLPQSFREVNPPKKVKFQLIQPTIMCEGRSRVTGYFRGKIVEENDTHYKIQIKYNGEVLVAEFHKETKHFYHPDLQDLKLIE